MNGECIVHLNDAVTLQLLGAHVARVTLNRPQVHNAVNAALANGLELAVQLTEDDPHIRCIILTGAGQLAFCAGADLNALADGQAATLLTARGGFAGFVQQPRRKPWIAAVNGVALAGGTEIALACDLIVAAEHASFGLPEVQRGLIAAAGGLYRLTRAIPRVLAIELILTGQRLSAARAQQIGLVNRTVVATELQQCARELATHISGNAPLAVRESLTIARAAFDHDEQALQQMGEQAMKRLRASNDFKEGPRAFLEKRPPHWSGS
ncbi:enoyl-CoA hydratase-related protein [Stenotrophomonas sp. SY1]|uniref:enoyl-CoA hydratase-related protein n=1 Tax=Stenotrophomonas sp. SY1 TaxID=477235 RepID=UPI001E4737CD|nr:enoyl-CoA hydratase-related protein [Stenotrophomonas sp. SY1]MCD9088298.1 enoyl-CoA hydratase-related protein [Stenotrophomonas sp. SY1]